MDVPIDELLSDRYADVRRKQIDPMRAFPGLPEAGIRSDREQSQVLQPTSAQGTYDTSYVCVVDAAGNGFSATPSDLSKEHPIVPGLGFIVSPRGSQSWLDEKHASAVAPGKRPRLTPNPAMAFRNGRLFMPFGTPGGDVQCQAMCQAFLNVVEFGMTPQLAVEAAFFDAQRAEFIFTSQRPPQRRHTRSGYFVRGGRRADADGAQDRTVAAFGLGSRGRLHDNG